MLNLLRLHFDLQVTSLSRVDKKWMQLYQIASHWCAAGLRLSSWDKISYLLSQFFGDITGVELSAKLVRQSHHPLLQVAMEIFKPICSSGNLSFFTLHLCLLRFFLNFVLGLFLLLLAISGGGRFCLWRTKRWHFACHHGNQVIWLRGSEEFSKEFGSHEPHPRVWMEEVGFNWFCEWQKKQDI